MIKNSQRGSAKIIAFPARGRFAAGGSLEAFDTTEPTSGSNIASRAALWR